MNYLIVIVGPTAVGKSQLAVQLAQLFNCEIVSADSRQFYREMNVGTAKPCSDDLENIPHHFVNSHSVVEKFTTADYAAQANRKLIELFKCNKTQILCGGSGLYINALLNGLDEFPLVKENVRAEIKMTLEKDGIQSLQLQLKQLDPSYYKMVDLNNPQRLVRALEVCISSDMPYSSFLKKKTSEITYTPIKIGLDLPRKVLYEQINVRVDKMIQEGLEQEVQSLEKYKLLNALQTVGYSEFFDFFERKYTREVAIEKIKQHSRNYAKRQLTWFRKDEAIKWFEPNDWINIQNYLQAKIQ